MPNDLELLWPESRDAALTKREKGTGVSAAGWKSQSAAMDVTCTCNTQSCFTLINALKQTVEQEYQQRPNGVDPALRKPQLTRAYECSHNLMPTSGCLTPSSFLPLSQGAATHTQNWQLKQNQLTEITGTNEAQQSISKREKKRNKNTNTYTHPNAPIDLEHSPN